MKYEVPTKKSENEIASWLSRTDLSLQERIDGVLSALYYGETIAFSGDTLINEFIKAPYEEKRWLLNLFETFYGMCRTNYRIDESISILDVYQREVSELREEVLCTIDALREYKDIFKGE